MSGRDPRVEKALSYARDRRNDYGESAKSSRKNIPCKKRRSVRVARRHDQQLIAAGHDDIPPPRRAHGRKSPDAPLGEIVERRLRRRAAVGMIDPATLDARIARIRLRGRSGS